MSKTNGATAPATSAELALLELEAREHRWRLGAILVALVVASAASVGLTYVGTEPALAAAARFEGFVIALVAALGDAIRVQGRLSRARALRSS